LPLAFAVSKPVVVTLASVDGVTDHMVSVDALTSWLLPSENVAIAVNCRVPPTPSAEANGDVTVTPVTADRNVAVSDRFAVIVTVHAGLLAGTHGFVIPGGTLQPTNSPAAAARLAPDGPLAGMAVGVTVVPYV
jgi:hypothetical protein